MCRWRSSIRRGRIRLHSGSLLHDLEVLREATQEKASQLMEQLATEYFCLQRQMLIDSIAIERYLDFYVSHLEVLVQYLLVLRTVLVVISET
jgi:hypothetical protein